MFTLKTIFSLIIFADTYFGVSSWSDTERSEGQMICLMVAIASEITVALLPMLRTSTDIFFMNDARIVFCVLDF